MRDVDLRSDTVTRPCPAMLRAMVAAPLGDDVFHDDPTVQRLEAEAAQRLGKEAALFVPSGTMANQVALRCHTAPGDMVLMAEGAHMYQFESGALAMISGVLPALIMAPRGIMEAQAAEAAILPDNEHFAPATLLCVENTSNRGGGSVYPLEVLDSLGAMARRRGLATHLDGARVFNAQVASGIDVARIARDYDSVSVCLSKALGAPIGSLICGPRDFVKRARRVRKMLGGGMRQVGLLAAAGLYALDHNVERLAEDHRRAARLWQGLNALGWDAEEPPETNMVYVRAAEAYALQDRLVQRGLLAVAVAPDRLRMVTHLDVDDEGIERAINAFNSAEDPA